MRILKSYLIAVFFIFIFVSVFVFFNKKLSEKIDIGLGVTTSEEKVYLDVGGNNFKIPKNYISSREDWEGGKQVAVTVRALLPDFEPRTQKNMSIFKDPNQKRVINIFITEHSVPGSETTKTEMTRRLIYERKIYDHGAGKKREIKSYSGPHGLIKQKLQPPMITGDELFIAEKANGGFYWVSCVSEGVDRPVPSCKSYLDYSDNVVLKYRFPREFLGSWEEFDNQVLVFIRSFEIKDSKES